MKRQIHYISVLNVLACLCVIGMHCNGIVHRYETIPAWWLSFAIEVLAYWAVPAFFMISGATMMDYPERSTRNFIQRRLKKVGSPLVFWTAIFYIYKRINGSIEWTGFRSFLNMILNFQIEGTYWFFAPLFMIYISLPILSRLRNDDKLLRYTIAAGVLTHSVLPFLCNVLGLSFNGHLYFPMTGGYILYPLIGYYLHKTDFHRWQRLLIYLLGIIGIFIRFGHTGYTFAVQGTASTITWGYLNLPALMLSTAVFVFIKYVCQTRWLQNEKLQKSFRWLAGGSFGVYLIHIFIINQLTYRLCIDLYSPYWQLAGAFLVYIFAIMVVKIVQKIPVVKNLFP